MMLAARHRSLLLGAAGMALSCFPAVAHGQPQPLTPIVDAYPASGPAPLTVVFSGVRTTGKWGSPNDVEQWRWDFAYDGASLQPASGYLHNAVVATTYDRPGVHTCRLEVTDTPNDGIPRVAFVDVTIDVGPATHDPGQRTAYPPGTWGTGIQPVWASQAEIDAAEGYVQPVRQAFMQWSDVEPSEHGSYDWSRLDDALSSAAAADQMVAVQINSELPDWVFDHIAQTGTARSMRSPQFWDPDYVAYYQALVSALGEHIASSEHRSRVLYVRQQWNAVHTETTYYDSTTSGDAAGSWVDNPAWVWPPDGHRYEVEWTEAIALDYERQITTTFLDTFRPLGIGVTLRSISGHLPLDEQNAFYTNDDPTEWILLTNNTYGTWDGGQQHTREFTVMRAFGALGFEETWSDGTARIEERNPELSPEQDIYGVVLRSLEVGLPYIGIYGSDLARAEGNGEFRQAFAFANRHAGWHRYPRSAPGAWLVLGRFEGSTDWRRLQTLARDNWGVFLRQNDPSASSTPLSLVGDPASRFGLVARRIDAAASFDVDDALAEAIAEEEVELRISYLSGSGSIEVRIDDGGTLTVPAAPALAEEHGWTTATYSLAGPSLTGGPDGRTDLLIEPTSGAPVVHLVELARTGAPVVDPPDGGVAPDSGAGGASPNPPESAAPAAEAGDGCDACVVGPVRRSGAPQRMVAWLIVLGGAFRRRRAPMAAPWGIGTATR